GRWEPARPRATPAHVVVDPGDGADGGARVRARRLLLDRDRGGQPPDGVVEGLVHLAEELPGVGVEALDVAALALRVQRVEGERGLAGPGHTREDHQLLLGDLHGDVLEVVLAGARDDDAVELHRNLRSYPRTAGGSSPKSISPPAPRRGPACAMMGLCGGGQDRSGADGASQRWRSRWPSACSAFWSWAPPPRRPRGAWPSSATPGPATSTTPPSRA